MRDCGVQSSELVEPESAKRGKKSKREKTLPAGNRLHMALRRMGGWIQEMERKGEEGDILDHSCVPIEKFLFKTQRVILLFFPQTIKRQKSSFVFMAESH